jgi:Uma2 family endonuclease
MTIPPPGPVLETVADLLARLGNIPPERVRLQPPIGTATEADVVTAQGCELVAGTLVAKRVVLPDVDNLGRLLDRLGKIPPERVLLQPPPGTATETDVLAARSRPRKRLCELIDATLVEKAVGSPAAFVAALVLGYLDQFLRQHNLGVHLGPDAMFRMSGGNTRMPDIAFISWERLPADGLPDDPITAIPPDFAVEILSPSNTQAEINLKISEYLASGARLVWIIDPTTQSGEMLTSPGTSIPVPAGGNLVGDPVLPGFVLPLLDLFARTRRPGN